MTDNPFDKINSEQDLLELAANFVEHADDKVTVSELHRKQITGTLLGLYKTGMLDVFSKATGVSSGTLRADLYSVLYACFKEEDLDMGQVSYINALLKFVIVGPEHLPPGIKVPEALLSLDKWCDGVLSTMLTTAEGGIN